MTDIKLCVSECENKGFGRSRLISEAERHKKNSSEWESAALYWMGESDKLRAALADCRTYVAFAFDQGIEGAEQAGINIDDAIGCQGEKA